MKEECLRIRFKENKDEEALFLVSQYSQSHIFELKIATLETKNWTDNLEFSPDS